MNHARLLIAGLIALLSLWFSCSPRESSLIAPELKTTAAGLPAAVEKAGWEVEWAGTLREAKKEGSVVVYVGGAPSTAVKEAMPIIKNKYGINLETVAGRGSELEPRVRQERAAGLYIPDVFISGPNTLFSSPREWFDRLDRELVLPEVVNPDGWFEGRLPWRDKEGNRFLAFLYYRTPGLHINTELVGTKDLTSYFELLEPRWKGKIIIGDARTTGTSFGTFATLAAYKIVDFDYFRQLVKQGPVMRDERLVADWIARGKYPIAAFATTASSVARYVQAGAPIAEMDLKEGSFLTTGGSGTAVMNRRPHPNAARVFINWLLSKEGQVHMQKEMRYQSARADIGTEGVGTIFIREPGKKYYVQAHIAEDWISNEQERYLEIAQEIFGGR